MKKNLFTLTVIALPLVSSIAFASGFTTTINISSSEAIDKLSICAKNLTSCQDFSSAGGLLNLIENQEYFTTVFQQGIEYACIIPQTGTNSFVASEDYDTPLTFNISFLTQDNVKEATCTLSLG